MMKVFYSVMSLFFLFLLISCNQESQSICKRLSEAEVEIAVTSYLAEGVVLSEEVPAEGYKSPREALMDTAKYLSDDPSIVCIEYEGEKRPWLVDCRIEEPVLVADYRFAHLHSPHGCDFYYYLYATHPEYGIIGSVIYRYNENSDVDWGVSEVCSPRINDSDFVFIDKKTATIALEEQLGIQEHSEPFAVLLDTYYSVACQNFSWYIEVPDSSGLGHKEYLVNNILRKNSIYDVDPERFLIFADIVKLQNNLNLLDVIKQTKAAINSGDLESIPNVPCLRDDEFGTIY